MPTRCIAASGRHALALAAVLGLLLAGTANIALKAEAAFVARPSVMYAVSKAFALNLSAVPSYEVPVDQPPHLAGRGGPRAAQ